MVARFTGATLGLLAFSITVVAGLSVSNPPTLILSRGILALFVFCVIGLVLGSAAQLVIREHEKNREAEIVRRYHPNPSPPSATVTDTRSATDQGVSVGM